MSHPKLIGQQNYYVSDDEDYIVLYESGSSYILYVRNYFVQTEFLIISQDLTCLLPLQNRTVSGVYFPAYFSVLKTFRNEVIKHVISNGLLPHFYHLFDCTISDFIENI